MDGELDSEDAKRIQAHVLACKSCNAEYQSLLFAYNLVAHVRLIESPPRAWAGIESRIRTAPPKRGILRNLLFPNVWVPVGALAALVLATGSLLWVGSSDDRSQSRAMQQVLRTYIQERDRAFGGNVHAVNYNPFRDNTRRPKDNPFKAE